jgi:hypothetical protein
MPLQGRYLYAANMDTDPEHADLLEEVYDTEHIPAILKVPGVISVARFKKEELTMMLGGEKRTIVVDDEPLFSALYELESPDVLLSDAWAAATEIGRWPAEVRPYTTNRRPVLRRRVYPAD